MENLIVKFFCKLIQGFYGKMIWHQIIKKNKKYIGNTSIILMPACVDKDNYFAMLYLNQLIEKYSYNNAVVITQDKRVQKNIQNFSQYVSKVIFCSSMKINAIIQYYLMGKFDERLIVASMNIPLGRNGNRLIGLKGLTEEKVFAIGVYNLYPFYEEKKKIWKGSVFENV